MGALVYNAVYDHNEPLNLDNLMAAESGIKKPTLANGAKEKIKDQVKDDKEKFWHWAEGIQFPTQDWKLKYILIIQEYRIFKFH